MEKSINTKLKEARISKNISAQEVADYLGMSQSNYSRIENNKLRLSVETFLKVCDYLKVDPKSFLGNEEEKQTDFIKISKSEYKNLSEAKQTLSLISKNIFKNQKY